MNICLDCGEDYNYDPSNPLGASSTRCPKCRKRDSVKNKKLKLFLIAGHGVAKCRKCGYNNSINALNLIDGVSFLDPPSPEVKAKQQFILCNNCKAEIDSHEIEFKVTNSKVTPIEVSFFLREVKVIRTEIKPSVEYHHDYQEVEIADNGGENARVVGKTKRISGERSD